MLPGGSLSSGLARAATLPTMAPALSILDLAPIGRDGNATQSLADTVTLAQMAEECGYRRVWYAEHHNMARIASSATSVIVAHVACHTKRIRLGAGGVMLPNHSPLTIAEQFGTLECLHPGRIDLGLGRAPGADRSTMRALRRELGSTDRFPEDVLELQGYLKGESRIPGVDAIPGKGTDVPIYILGSSLYGAQLAAMLGLPYAFASHFAPDALEEAVSLYRRQFQPSADLEKPYVIAGVNAAVAEDKSDAEAQLRRAVRSRVSSLLAAGRQLSDEEADSLLESPAGRHVARMLTYAAVGTPSEARLYLESFAEKADADELIVVLQSSDIETRVRSGRLLAEAFELA